MSKQTVKQETSLLVIKKPKINKFVVLLFYEIRGRKQEYLDKKQESSEDIREYYPDKPRLCRKQEYLDRKQEHDEDVREYYPVKLSLCRKQEYLDRSQ